MKRIQTTTERLKEQASKNGEAGIVLAKIAPKPAEWPDPIPLDDPRPRPGFPLDTLPLWLRAWVGEESTATQTPPDLAAMLSLTLCAAGIAGKIRVEIRNGWREPGNLMMVCALPPGERKSRVFSDALAPIVKLEAEERLQMADIIAEAASEHRMLESSLKKAEEAVAKERDSAKKADLKVETKALAIELAAHLVPEFPKLFVDDETPESLSQELARQGGRLLQASAEGTLFSIVLGRYGETPVFDVYLKGHAGDPLRVGRVSRQGETINSPALSVAVCVQPDVVEGLASEPSLRGRGFLARWLYSMPDSKVGSRLIGCEAVRGDTAREYAAGIESIWRHKACADDEAGYVVCFGEAADEKLKQFERWLEPKLADGEELSSLAGWANKLAGACARIALALHIADTLPCGKPWNEPIPEETVDRAIRIGKEYLLPHAQFAFDLMGADQRANKARKAWEAIRLLIANEVSEYSESAPPTLSRRDIHQCNRRTVKNAEGLEPVLELLVDRFYLRPVGEFTVAGRGRKSPHYEVNPKAMRLGSKS